MLSLIYNIAVRMANMNEEQVRYIWSRAFPDKSFEKAKDLRAQQFEIVDICKLAKEWTALKKIVKE